MYCELASRVCLSTVTGASSMIMPCTALRSAKLGAAAASNTIGSGPVTLVRGASTHFQLHSSLAAQRSCRLQLRGAMTAAAAAPAVEVQPKADLVLIPGGKGKATFLEKGQVLKVINTHGMQVVDFWAFKTGEEWGHEIMSMHHTRNALMRSTPRPGDMLYTASMAPIMTFLEDSGPGVHDTTAAACSFGLYVLQIGEEAAKEHDSCTNNLYNALKELDLQLAEDPRYGYYTPAPFNLWMNVADEPDEHGWNWEAPVVAQKAKPQIVFPAKADRVAVFALC